jgi:large subunit ribosomal protein L29
MNPREIREKTLEEVKNDLLAAEENLRTFHFQLVTSQLENTSVLKKAKKEVARIKTILREHELGIHTLAVPDKSVDGEEMK